MNPSRRWVKWYRGSSNVVLDAMIMFLLGGMVLLATAQIILRNVFSISLYWGDDLLQLALLWLVMAGAVAAARSGEHLRINILIHYVPRKLRPWTYAALHGFTSVICGTLAWQAVQMVHDSAVYGDLLLGEVPAWAAQLILPASFGFLALHYALKALSECCHGLWRRSPSGGAS
jgi:TRAP-type C4-dicarboxylate transport system permease small subunit